MTQILILEDHVLFSGALGFMLRRRLFSKSGELTICRNAHTVAEGLRLLDEEGPFDVAVVDLMLPDGDGTEVVRRIRASYPETRVAVLSAVRDLSGAMAAGADETIGKGTPLSEITARIARLACGGGRPAT